MPFGQFPEIFNLKKNSHQILFHWEEIPQNFSHLYSRSHLPNLILFKATLLLKALQWLSISVTFFLFFRHAKCGLVSWSILLSGSLHLIFALTGMFFFFCGAPCVLSILSNIIPDQPKYKAIYLLCVLCFISILSIST